MKLIIGLGAPGEGDGKSEDGANDVPAILFVPQFRACAVLQDARFPLSASLRGA